jgi:hypothetical protein
MKQKNMKNRDSYFGELKQNYENRLEKSQKQSKPSQGH